MIGNDIVDLAEAEKASNWQRPRFLEKIFTPREQGYIHNSENPFLMVWRLWSMKEAAYKLYTQLNPSRFYNPKAFECEINDLDGKVIYKSFSCYVKSKLTSNYVLSETQLVEMDMASEFVDNDSKYIKEILLSKIAEYYQILKDELSIEKSEFGIPSVFQNSKQLNISISITHHGNYGAYAFK